MLVKFTITLHSNFKTEKYAKVRPLDFNEIHCWSKKSIESLCHLHFPELTKLEINVININFRPDRLVS